MSFEKDSTMSEVSSLLPFAQILLQEKFHLGGCQKCAYQPHQTLAEVAVEHGKNVDDLLKTLNEALHDAADLEIEPVELGRLMCATQLRSQVMLIDVREDWEYNHVHLPGAILLRPDNMNTVFAEAQKVSCPVVICHHGVRSLNAAQYMRSHSIRARSLRGGMEAYAIEVDAALERY